MIKIRRLIIFILLPALVIPAGAADVRDLLLTTTGLTESDIKSASSSSRIDLFDLYALAVSGTERLAIEGENAIQADYRMWQTIGALLPSVSLKTTRYLQEDDPAVSGRKSGMLLYARQNLVIGLDQYAGIKGNCSERLIERYRLGHAAGMLLLDLAQVYLEALKIEKTLMNREKVLENYRGISAELKRRVAVGRSRQSDLLRTNSQIFRLEAEIQSLQDRKRSALVSLGTLAGLPGAPELDHNLALIAPSAQADSASAIAESRYDVKAAAEEVALAETRLLGSLDGNLPSVYIEGTYRILQEEKTGRDYYAGLGVEVPIIDGGVTVSRAMEMRSVKRQAELRLKQTRRASLAEIDDARASFESSLREVESYKKALDAAEADYAAILREYGLNLVTILDVFNSLTDLVSSRDDYEQSLLDKCLNRVKLGVATGEFLGKGIAALRPVRGEGRPK